MLDAKFWSGTTYHELTRVISRVNLMVNPNPCMEQMTLSLFETQPHNWSTEAVTTLL